MNTEQNEKSVTGNQAFLQTFIRQPKCLKSGNNAVVKIIGLKRNQNK
jgi:hypothetical protein